MPFSSFPRAARLGFAGGLLLLAACEKDSDTRAAAVLPTTITFTQTGLYPEGVQYDDQQARYLVSSETTGSIGQLRDDGQAAATGTYADFIKDDLLISTIGLKLDVPRGRLLAAVSDPGFNAKSTKSATLNQLARLVVFDRSNGTKISSVDLSALPGLPAGYPRHFANDVAIDNQGNAYVTDSFAPVIYKVAFTGLSQSTASIFSTDAAFVPTGKFGLNGIVYHPNGYLLVAKSDDGTLLKVTVPAANATNQTIIITKVALPSGLSLSGADGLQLTANTTLLAACNTQGKVYQLTSADDFVTVTSPKNYDTGGGYPTTLARRADNTSYVLQAHLNALQAGQPAVSQYTLQKVAF